MTKHQLKLLKFLGQIEQLLDSCWTATRRQSCSSWDLPFVSVPTSQFSDRQYKSVMKSSTGFPFSCFHLLSPTLSKLNIHSSVCSSVYWPSKQGALPNIASFPGCLLSDMGIRLYQTLPSLIPRPFCTLRYTVCSCCARASLFMVNLVTPLLSYHHSLPE